MERNRQYFRRGFNITKKILAAAPVICLGLLFLLPLAVLVSGSVADLLEWQERLKPLFMAEDGFITWKWVPDYPTIENYRRLLFYSPGFMQLFWNSVRITALILAGQCLAGVPAAWAFAVYRFRGRKWLFGLYIILMLLPFQVTMLSKYLVLRGVGLLNTQASVILPAVFSTFPVFLVYRGFREIPPETLEAARMDGAGEYRIFLQIGLPQSKGDILACLVLNFLECWNMMEEPLAFLQDKSLWPLSLYLPEIGLDQAGFAAAASVVTLILSLLVFALFQDSLERGID